MLIRVLCVCVAVWCACTCRLAGGDPALVDLVRRRDELASWLQRAELAVGSLPLSAGGENLRELKVEEKMCRAILACVCLCFCCNAVPCHMQNSPRLQTLEFQGCVFCFDWHFPAEANAVSVETPSKSSWQQHRLVSFLVGTQ